VPWRGPKIRGEKPTLGFLVLDFVESNCVIPDGLYQGEPFILSEEQKQFVLGLYELKPDAKPNPTKPSRAFVSNRGGQLVAPQKWGKGPFSAALTIAEAYGPVLFDGWDADGEPVGRSWPTPHIQITAVSEDQTENVYRALLPMITLGDLKYDIPDTGLTRINLPNGGLIEPVTASARSRLGQRITFAVEDEAHDWNRRNGGRKLADTQRRNLAGTGGRFLETGNAWDPNEDSVAQNTFEKETGVYKLMLHGGSGSIANKRERMRVLGRVYEHSWWVDADRISAEIDNLLERGELAQAERFFMNRIVPGEDRAFELKRWNALVRAGYVVNDGAMITIGIDGARYEDALAIIGTEIESGHQFVLGIWERPENSDDEYEHSMHEVDGVIEDAFNRFDVWRAYCDPGSTVANILPWMEKWQGKFGEKKVIEWQMNRPKPAAYMVRHYTAAIASGDLTHDGNRTFSEHIANARRKATTVLDEDGRVMYLLSKESPHSLKKIDAAAAAALAWEARGDAIAAGVSTTGGYDDPRVMCARCGHLKRHHIPQCRARPEGHCDAYVSQDGE